MRRLLASLIVAGFTLLEARSVAEHRVFTLLDYYESGRRAVETFIRDSEASGASPNLAATVARCKTYCVRLDIRFDHGDSRVESAVATGVLVDGGRRVFTAGHSFEGTGEIEIVVTYPDGAARKARLARREYDRFGSTQHDWALLDVVDAPERPAAIVASKVAPVGAMVVALGYPDEIGIDAAGKIAYAAASEAEANEPLTTVAVIDHADPVRLRPWAGAIPTRGMSGGPVFDLNGRLLGVFVAVSTTVVSGEVTHAYEVCSAGAARGPRAVVARGPRVMSP